MERRRSIWWTKKSFWAAVIMKFAMLTTATNITAHIKQVEQYEGYAWSAWGNWGPCSRTCGGGVSVQERQCLPRSRAASNGTIAPPVITVRVTRQAQDCLGVAKRYHQCNTAPCSGGERDVRAEQCASYDHRPFRGRFYTWVPYIEGDSPCLLNCRPLGQHFYASLGLAADGTPCTKPGYRAICIQGTCKVVGRETVLALAASRELRCGRRLVSGLFSRPRLPLGYSYVTTVPRGACRLNVSEIVSSDNYIALKISNGSYIMNGEFAVSAPGSYEAAGTRFVYTRAAGLDSVFALGPIHHSIDIMILYTQPNPNIKYEYFTESLPGEVDVEPVMKTNLGDLSTVPTKHIRRHHGFDTYPRPKPNIPRHPDLIGLSRELTSSENSVEETVVGSRKFMWKILSFTPCSRTCGGGFQVGKFRCVETNANGADKETSPVHCSGSPPAGRRRRCGTTPCAPRWRAAAWSTCPKCGTATKTRIVGCVQDHSRGIIKISDHKCPAPKPPTTEICDIPDCPSSGEVWQVESKRHRPPDHTDTFREGPVYTLSVNNSEYDIGPEYSFSAAAGWLYTDWSECVGWCVGGGLQTRKVRCADPSGCGPRKSPEASRTCTPSLPCEPHDGQWFTGEWSPCSSECGGKQVRGVLCIGGTGRHLRDSACKSPKPETERTCGGDCPPTWFYSDWGQCMSNCSVGVGVQRRSVVCGRGESGAARDVECPALRPPAHRSCTPNCDEYRIMQQSEVDIETSSSSESVKKTEEKQDQAKEHTGRRDCEDKLNNCMLAVQARLCHYKYYTQNCCHSCGIP